MKDLFKDKKLISSANFVKARRAEELLDVVLVAP